MIFLGILLQIISYCIKKYKHTHTHTKQQNFKLLSTDGPWQTWVGVLIQEWRGLNSKRVWGRVCSSKSGLKCGCFVPRYE